MGRGVVVVMVCVRFKRRSFAQCWAGWLLKDIGVDRLECCKDGAEDGEAEAPERVVVITVCAKVMI